METSEGGFPSKPSSDIGTARTKVELLYRDMLLEASAVTERLERVSGAQAEFLRQAQKLPASLDRMAAATASKLAAQARSELQEATRGIAIASSELRIASRAYSYTLSAAALRNCVLCCASACIGGVVGASAALLFSQ